MEISASEIGSGRPTEKEDLQGEMHKQKGVQASVEGSAGGSPGAARRQ